MATQTTGKLKLSKPAYNDNADVAVLNGDFDKIDAAVTQEAGAMAIVSDSNTHAAIISGQYVYVFNHSSLSQGLYKAKSNIAQNATLSTSNLQAVPSGGLNSLLDSIDILSALVEPHGNLPNNTDLNMVQDQGVYYLGSTYTYSNLPPSVTYGVLIVEKASDSKIVQFVVSPLRLYIRIKTANDESSWGIWRTDEMHRGNAPSGLLSDVTDTGIYGIPAGTSYTDKPSSDAYIMFVLKPSRTASNLVQITFGYNRIYWRYISGTVRQWKGISSFVSFTVSIGGSKTCTVENNAKAMIVFVGSRGNLCGTAIVNATSTGTIAVVQTGASDVVITSNANEITIQNNNTAAGVVCNIQLFSSGDIIPQES